MTSVELLSFLRVITGVGSLAVWVLDCCEVRCCDDELHVVCVEHVRRIGVISSLLLGLGNKLHTDSLLDELHGRKSISAGVLQVMELDDLKEISVGVIKTISVYWFGLSCHDCCSCCALLLCCRVLKKRRKIYSNEKERPVLFYCTLHSVKPPVYLALFP